MKFNATIDALPKMLQHITSDLNKLECTRKEQHQIELSLEEVLVNIINYAYPKTTGSIEIITTTKEPNQVEFIIKDWGIPFDPTLQMPDLQQNIPLEKRKIGGLGIFFIYELMDKVTYARKDNTNILTLTKKLNC